MSAQLAAPAVSLSARKAAPFALEFDSDDADNEDNNREDDGTPLSPGGYESEYDESDDDEVDEEEEAAFAMMNQLQLLETRNARTFGRSTSSGAAFLNHGNLNDKRSSSLVNSAGMELKQAEERIVKLEAQLLDAEETIYHLKAEKLQALRDVEKLTIALEDMRSSHSNDEKIADKINLNIWEAQNSSFEDGEGGQQRSEDNYGDASDDDGNNIDVGKRNGGLQGRSLEELREYVRELQYRLEDQGKDHVLEQEERMAVIREQELELRQLKQELDTMTEKYDELLETHQQQSRQVHLHSSTSSSSRQGDTSAAPPFDYDHDEEEFVLHRGLKRKSSSSMDSSSSALFETGHGSTYSNGTEVEYPTTSPAPWREELVRHPTPHFDLDSPEVHYLLHSWTTNLQKLQYLRMWFAQVAMPSQKRGSGAPLPPDFPLGVELPRLSPEIRDGFLTLVVPLLRKQTLRDIVVHSRQYNDAYHTDLRIRVVPRPLF
jgi:hypothetical protein|uniref:Uncharacterized protein n=1 Tax=Globisporangium ultimum (strain ATCC 200006 / CBS 805.95 / DAOM BR144) TaxID=431595 RepID=K3WJ42_GLOUD